jgi:hypothetical protein
VKSRSEQVVLIVSFHTRELLERCSSLEKAELLHGAAAAQALIGVLADIEALDNCGELMDLFGEDAKIVKDNMISLNFGSDHFATFIAVGAKLVHLRDGNLDWRLVKRLKLIEIKDS